MDQNVYIRRLMKEIGVSYPSIKKYLDSESIPADICLQLEQLSQGHFKPVELRPDVFVPTTEHVYLSDALLRTFDEDKNTGASLLFITALNLLQTQAPTTYNDLLDSLGEIDADYTRMRSGSVSD